MNAAAYDPAHLTLDVGVYSAGLSPRPSKSSRSDDAKPSNIDCNT
jgi:hypothetical protein